MNRLFLLLLVCAMVPVQAGVLWVQAPVSALNVDQEFPDFSGNSTYQVHDVTVGAGGWNITSITGYYSYGSGSWPATANVRINIFPKAGSLPAAGDDPTAGAVYSASLTNDGSTTSVTAGGLSIGLAPGDYWIGIAPIISFSPYGQEFHKVAESIVGDPTALRNPGGSFGVGTEWGTYALFGGSAADGAILIEGDAGAAVPEPATWSLLALGISALVCFRRRR